MRRKAMTLDKEESILIPPFQGVAVIEYSDRVQLRPTYWCREFVAYGRIDIAKQVPGFLDHLEPDKRAALGNEIWVIAWWERHENGQEKVIEMRYINGTTPETDVRHRFQEVMNFMNLTKEEFEELGELFEQTSDNIAYVRNRFPEGCPDPKSIEEYDLYQARLKVLAGMQPKTVEMMERANRAEHPGDRQGYEHEAVSAYFVDLAHHWTEDQVREWQRSNPIGTEWMCEFAQVLRNPRKKLDPINHALVLDWLRKGLNLLTAEELAATIFKTTGWRMNAAAIKKRRDRLYLTTKRPPGPRPNVDL